MNVSYDPNAQFEIRIWEKDFRKVPSRMLMARICQPVGDGPFPVLLDLHGGAWARKDRYSNTDMAEALAKSGILVVSIDMRISGEAPYPANVQDAHYGIRWLKLRAASWGGDPATIGVLGSSTGGHIAQLIGMRPDDPRYGEIPLRGGEGLDARMNYIVCRSPISDPKSRYENAVARGNDKMVERHHIYFNPFGNIEEGNPQMILDRGESVVLPPMLIMQGGEDDNVLPVFQEKFGESYRAAGGDCKVEVFEGCGHLWVLDPGPETDRAHEMVKAFIAERLRTIQKAA